jgi:hypothetical protein
VCGQRGNAQGTVRQLTEGNLKSIAARVDVPTYRRVVRTIVAYRASDTGRADARGRIQGRIQVTYKAAKQTHAQHKGRPLTGPPSPI